MGSMRNNQQIPFFLYNDSKESLIVKALILIIFSLFFVFPGRAATLSMDSDYTGEEGFMTMPFSHESDGAFNFGEMLSPLNETRTEIVDLIRQGIDHLRNGQKKEGLESLERAWALDTSEQVAGLAIAIAQIKYREYDAALKTSQKLQKWSPTSPDGYTVEGIVYAGMGNQQQMRAAFEKALEISPGDPKSGNSLATYHYGIGNIEQAKNILKDVLTHNPNSLKTTLMLAEMEFKSNQIHKALPRIESTIEDHPNKLYPRYLLAQMYLALNLPSNALAELQYTLVHFPNRPDILELTAVAYIKNGAFQEAVELLDVALKKVPDSVTLHYNLALAYENLKKLKLASREVETALKLDSSNVSAQFLSARLLAKTGKFDSALNLLKELDVSFPENPDLKELEANIALAQNKPDKAILLLQDTLRKRESKRLNIQLAKSQFRAGKQSNGYSTLQNWIAKYPNDILTRTVLADIYLSNGKFDEALQQYSELVEINPKNIWAINNIAWLFAQKGDFDEAFLNANLAYELSPENPQVIDTLGEIMLRKGQVKKAVELFRKAAEKSPESLSIHYHLSQALVSVNNLEEAKELLKKLLAKDQQFKEYQQAQQLLKELESK